VRRGLLAYAPVPQVSPACGQTSDEPGRLDWIGQLHIPAISFQRSAVMIQLSAISSQRLAGRGSGQRTGSLAETDRANRRDLSGGRRAGWTLLIDQHAAHERVLFEKLMAQHDQKKIPSQTLLTPTVVQLPPASANY